MDEKLYATAKLRERERQQKNTMKMYNDKRRVVQRIAKWIKIILQYKIRKSLSVGMESWSEMRQSYKLSDVVCYKLSDVLSYPTIHQEERDSGTIA